MLGCAPFLLGGCIRRKDVGAQGQKLAVVSLAYWGQATEVAMMTRTIAEFETANPDIRVKLIHIPGDYNAKLQTMMAANRAPDVFYLLSQDCVGYMHRGALTDLTPFLNRSRVLRYGDFFPETVRQFKIGPRLYALSFDWSPMVVFYNKEFFDQAGVAYPHAGWTWNDFLDAAQKLTVRDKQGHILRYGTLPVDWRQWVIQNGGQLFNAARDRCTLDSPEALQGMQFAYDLTAKYKVCPPQNDPEVEASVYLMSGKAAMIFSYRWMITMLQSLKRYPWRIGPVPQGKVKVNLSGAVGFAISNQCRHREAAWRLIEFLCGPKGQFVFVRALWGVPTLKSLLSKVDAATERAHPTYNYRLFQSETQYAQVLMGSPYIPEQRFTDVVQEETDRMYIQQQTPEETMRNITRRVNAIIAANKAREEGRDEVRKNS